MNKTLKYYFRNKKSLKRKKILGPFAKGVVYETENGVISMPVEDLTIGKELGFKGKWDMDEINLLLDAVTPSDTIYIVGTHVGTLLVPIAKKVNQVVGYEANENTFWFMQMNLCLNKLTNVQLFHKAVGNEKKVVRFYQNSVNTGGSKIKPVTDSILYNYDQPNEVSVDMLPLDAHIKDEGLPKANGIIMDIEGAEYVALQGMQKTLSEVRFLYVEFVPHHLQNVADIDVAQFLETIAPHFNQAHFVRNGDKIAMENTSDELLSYLESMMNNNKSDDILFSK
ncbi:MAG: FkbM family methyltransferase [Marinirhabdus sp.]|nr:FkbM family methyltransferase [Marinirhabdus sp.]